MLINSRALKIEAGGLFDLNSRNQTVQNLSGQGSVNLGSATLTATGTETGSFDGIISGSGSLVKAGTGSLTLSGANTYGGTTAINGGRLIAVQGGALSQGTVTIDSLGTLELAFNEEQQLNNRLSGSGALIKTGTGQAVLTYGTSGVGASSVTGGTLALAENVDLSAASHTTQAGAATELKAGASLNLSGDLRQMAGAALKVTHDQSAGAIITADKAYLGGTLTVNGLNTAAPAQASQLSGRQMTLVSSIQDIEGDFDSISFGAIQSPADYLTLAGYKSLDLKKYSVGLGLSWLAGSTRGHGNFTLAEGEEFIVDLNLTNQTPVGGGWDGRSLTKNGAGNLVLAGANSYSGSTSILAGTVTAGAGNVLASSAKVSISSGAVLDLADFNQLVNHLEGAGEVRLGNGLLTVNNSTAGTTFRGNITGQGGLTKSGGETLTLTGDNSYSGDTTIADGRLVATSGSALGSGRIIANSTLELALADDVTLANQLGGTGAIEKTRAGTLTLTNTSSSVGTLNVKEGGLAVSGGGTLAGVNLYTQTGAATSLDAFTKINLTGALVQKAGAELNIGVSGTDPFIKAGSAALDGDLNIIGFDPVLPASALTMDRFTVIETTSGLTGDFVNVDFGGVVSGVDYLILDGRKEIGDKEYTVGFALAWLAGQTQAHGDFTLDDPNYSFTLDIALADRSLEGPFDNWSGNDLTKRGLGNLILSKVNSYTGYTLIESGPLTATIADAFALSKSVTINENAGLIMTANQTAQNLSGQGSVDLGSAILTAKNTQDSTFEGGITGAGRLIKSGLQTLTLTGNNSYQGGTLVQEGRLKVTGASSLGSGTVETGGVLELAFDSDDSLGNQLTGSGQIEKTGTGRASLTSTNSDTGRILIKAGSLELAQTGTLKADAFTVENGASALIGGQAKLSVDGLYAQADNSEF